MSAIKRVYRLFLTLSVCAAQMGHAQQSSVTSIRALEPGGRQALDTVQLGALFHNAKQLFTTGNLEEAADIYRNTLTLSKAAGYQYGIANSAIGMALCYMHTGRHQEAEKMLLLTKKSCERAEKKRPNMIARWYEAMGVNLSFLNKNDSAIWYLNTAADIAGNINDSMLLESIYINLGASYGKFDQFDNGIVYLKRAEKISLLTDSLFLHIIYANIASYYSKINNEARALIYAEKAADLAKKKQDFRNAAYALSVLGGSYLKEDQPEKAVRYFQEGLQLSDTTNPLLMYIFYWGLGAAYHALEQYDQAQQYSLDALRFIGKTDREEMHSAGIYKLLANVSYQLKDYRQAYLYSSQYAALSDSFNNIERKMNVDELNVKFQVAEKELQLSQRENKIREKNFWILIIVSVSVIAIISLILLYVVSRNKTRIKTIEMQQLQQQQKIKQLQAIMHGEESERKRIAKELHDGVASIISAAKMQLSNVGNKNLSVVASSDIYNNGLALLQEAYDEVRFTSHNLTSEKILEEGLANSLDKYCKRISMPPDFNIYYHHFGEKPELADEMTTGIYRIVQELLHNIQKHACATEVNVQTGYDRDVFFLSIEDNGAGIDAQDYGSPGIGMQNLESRIALWNGTIEVDSRPDDGTTVYIQFSLKIIERPASFSKSGRTNS